ncbi:hypothetical protein [Peterkaempfera griseoplana]|uniref:hypothetical protein n=1 Tax=Peterkaempfera griseoplana TaxID=66896 RepID=UPI0006E3F08C|nr:hypothetical protein [Peterkaempfera griseoplana]
MPWTPGLEADRQRRPSMRKREPWRGVAVPLLALAVGAGVAATVALRWGGAEWPTAMTVALTAVAVGFAATKAGGGRPTQVVVALLCAAFLLVGSAALTDQALARRGEQVEAVVTSVQRSAGRGDARSCTLHQVDGRSIPHSLSPCDGYQVGDRLQVTVDPLGRQAPEKGGRDDLAPVGEAEVALSALALLVLVLVGCALRSARRARSLPFTIRPHSS